MTWSSHLSLQCRLSSKSVLKKLRRGVFAVAAVVATAQIATAQETAVPAAPEVSTGSVASVTAPVVNTTVPSSSFVILDPDRLYSESAFGLRIQDELKDLARKIQSENGNLTRDLEAEELNLLDRRDSLSAEEFRDLADAFDEKVQSIRDAQELKGQVLTTRANEGRQEFNEASLPVLRTILAERNALGILDSRVVFLPAQNLDITNEAILRVDQVLKDGLP